MASFDFVDCSSRAYRFVWDNREEVVRLSAMVVVLKIISFVAFVAFDLQEDILRQGLFLLPSYFLEGWVIARLMLMALYEDASAGKGGRSILPGPEHVERNMKASMIVYVLTKLMLTFVLGMTLAGKQAIPHAPPAEPSGQIFILAGGMLVFTIWAFRFFWLYVPLVMGRGPAQYMIRFKAYSSSFYMLGVWVLCFVPLVLLMILASEGFSAVLQGLGMSEQGVAFQSILGAVQAVIDYALALVSSLGIAFGIYSVFNDENKKTEIW